MLTIISIDIKTNINWARKCFSKKLNNWKSSTAIWQLITRKCTKWLKRILRNLHPLLKVHTAMPEEPVRAQLIHPHSHSSEARNSGWITHRTSVTGVTCRWPSQILEFLTNPLLNLRDHHHTVMLEVWVKAQLIHLHNHSSEAKNNGWITHKTSAIGVTCNKLSLTLESLTLLLWLKLRSKLFLKDKLLSVSLVKLAILEVQRLHLLNHSSEEKSNGFQMLKTSKTGEFIKWK